MALCERGSVHTTLSAGTGTHWCATHHSCPLTVDERHSSEVAGVRDSA